MVVIKDMTEELIKLHLKYSKMRNFIDSVLFLPALIVAILKNRADRHESLFWISVNNTFPRYKEMDQTVRKDYTIKFSSYED